MDGAAALGTADAGAAGAELDAAGTLSRSVADGSAPFGSFVAAAAGLSGRAGVLASAIRGGAATSEAEASGLATAGLAGTGWIGALASCCSLSSKITHIIVARANGMSTKMAFLGPLASAHAPFLAGGGGGCVTAVGGGVLGVALAAAGISGCERDRPPAAGGG